jgi:site-specific recombinase XerD
VPVQSGCITTNHMNSNFLNTTDAAIPSTMPEVGTVANNFASFRGSWIRHLRDLGRSFHSVQTYNSALLNLERFLEGKNCTTVESVTPENLSAWQIWLVADGRKPATVDLFTRTARGFFRWLACNGHVFLDAGHALRIPKVPRVFGVIPTTAEIAAVLDGISGQSPLDLRDRALLELAYSTAARLGELHHVDITSIQPGAGTIRLYGKGDRERVVPLGKSAQRALETYLANGRPHLARAGKAGDALWVSTRATRLHRIGIEILVKRRAAVCGLVFTPHAIRRAAATHLLQGGMSLSLIKDLLGHQTYSHLRHYLRPVEALTESRSTKPVAR